MIAMMTNTAILSRTRIQRAKNKRGEHVTEMLDVVNKQQLPVCFRDVRTFQETHEKNWHLWHAFTTLASDIQDILSSEAFTVNWITWITKRKRNTPHSWSLMSYKQRLNSKSIKNHRCLPGHSGGHAREIAIWTWEWYPVQIPSDHITQGSPSRPRRQTGAMFS